MHCGRWLALSRGFRDQCSNLFVSIATGSLQTHRDQYQHTRWLSTASANAMNTTEKPMTASELAQKAGALYPSQLKAGSWRVIEGLVERHRALDQRIQEIAASGDSQPAAPTEYARLYKELGRLADASGLAKQLSALHRELLDVQGLIDSQQTGKTADNEVAELATIERGELITRIQQLVHWVIWISTALVASCLRLSLL